MWQWNPEEVARFVGLVDDCEPYTHIFTDGHVTGVRLLRMTDAKLAQMGMDLDEISRLGVVLSHVPVNML